MKIDKKIVAKGGLKRPMKNTDIHLFDDPTLKKTYEEVKQKFAEKGLKGKISFA